MIADLDSLAVEKANLENKNTYLRAILSWVSSSEPQLGMVIKQFKRGDGFGVGYTYTKSDFDRLYGKIGKTAGNTASTSMRTVCLKNHQKHLRRSRFGFQSPMS